MSLDRIIALRSIPRLSRVAEMNAKQCVRTYRSSPEDVDIQIRRGNDYVVACLTIEQAKELAANLLMAATGFET